MKKQKKQLLILLLLLVLCVLAFVLLQFYNKKQEEKEGEDQTISLIPAESEDILSFSYYCENERMEFYKEDDLWHYKKDPELVLDADKMQLLTEALTSVEATQSLEDPAELSEYGLETPVNTLTLATAQDQWIVYLGDRNGISGQYYLRAGGDKTVYLTDTDYNAVFQVSLDEVTGETENEETVDSTETVDNTESVDSTEQ